MDKISDNPAGWESNCRKSHGSGSKNREPTAEDVNVSLRFLERSFSLAGRTVQECHTQLSTDSVVSLLFLHRALNDR